VFITSRNRRWQLVHDIVPIDVFTRTESLEFLTIRVPRACPNRASRLVNGLTTWRNARGGTIRDLRAVACTVRMPISSSRTSGALSPYLVVHSYVLRDTPRSP
jgi:hypothetical protein